MTTPGPDPAQEPLDLNQLSASDVTIPTPEGAPTSGATTPLEAPKSRPWRGTKKVTPPKTTPHRPTLTVPRPKRGQFVKPLTQTYTSVGVLLMPIDAVCGNAFIANAESVAKAWDEAAYENDTVRKFLTEFLRTSIATRIAMAHIPILMAMLIHHSKRAQGILTNMGEGFAETVENNMRAGDMGNGIPED